MDIDELASFVAVCRMGSFTKAAADRGLTQPGVSRHVQRLERQLSTQLFDRGHGPPSITEAGSRLLTYAEDALARHDRFVQSMHTVAAPLAGELRIAASTTPGECLLPTLLAEFTVEHPAVTPQLFVADSAEVISELRGRQWELGFVGVRLPARNLQFDVIGEDEVVLVVPEGHALAGRATISLSELVGQPFIEREGGSGTLRAFRAALGRAGIPVPRYHVVMVLNSNHAILSAVHSGLGLGLVSSLEFEQHGFAHVHQARVADLPLRRQLYMVRPRSRPLPAVASAFASWVLKRWDGRPAGETRAPARA